MKPRLEELDQFFQFINKLERDEVTWVLRNIETWVHIFRSLRALNRDDNDLIKGMKYTIAIDKQVQADAAKMTERKAS